jgi:CrcB protein
MVVTLGSAGVRPRLSAGLLAAVAVGGAAGTLLRVAVGRAFPAGVNGFPWDTLIVNLAGSLVLGFVVVTALERGAPTRYFRPLVGTGFCGGLTTFSTFVVEMDLLVRAGHAGTAILYLAASLAGGLAVARLGVGLARAAWNKETR